MLANWTDKPKPYKDFKRETFEKYGRKIEAIISNIEHNSLGDKDKVALKKELIEQLQKSIV